MTVDEIDFSKLKPYNKSQYQSFELLWYLICKEEYKNGRFTPIDDSGGGDGIEFYLTLDNGDVWGWQCKFFDRLSKGGRKGQITSSLKKACEVHGRLLKKWVLCSLSDFTPDEREWYFNDLKETILTDCSDLELLHFGDSDLCYYLNKYPVIGNAFFGTYRFDDNWFDYHYKKVMNREEIKEKYIADLHSKTQLQGELYSYIGGPLLGAELASRLNNEEMSSCLTAFTESIDNLYNYNCEEQYVDIKNEAIKYLQGNEKIISEIQDMIHLIISELKDPSASSPVKENIEMLNIYYETLKQIYVNFSSFKHSKTIAPISWDAEDKETDRQNKSRIKTARETILGPYFVLKDYWDPINYVLDWLQLIDKQEIHIKGDASKGKSHLILDLFKQYHDKSLPAVFISAKDFKTEENVCSQILEVLDLPSGVTFKTFLDNLNMFGKQKGVKSLLVIDGLNESLRWNIIWESGLSEIRSEITTGRYENLIFITTYRTSYEEEIFGDFFNQLDNYYLNFEISGFDEDNFEDALEKYKKYYNVTFTNNANIRLLFRNNPLALRIFCVTNKGRTVSLSNMTIFDVFDHYLAHCNDRIVEKLQLRKKLNKKFLLKKLSTLCDYAWEHNTNRISIDDANLSEEEIDAIEGENLLLYRDWYQEENVIFTYDLLAGYLISKNIIGRYNDKITFLADFESSILVKLISEDNKSRHPLYDDILSCLLTLAIDKFGFIFERFNSGKLVYHIIKSIYSSSVSTLECNRAKVETYLGQHLTSSKELLNLSLPIAFSLDNPLNFLFTSKLLKQMSIWERDLHWTAKIMDDLRYDRIEDGIIELIAKLSQPNTERFLSEAGAYYLMWLLTTNCHRLRFLVTKALFLYAKKQPNDFVIILKESLSINDLYVPERMLAVAYGLILNTQPLRLREESKTWVIEIANVVWESIFSSNPILITAHINIRHYSRRIIEIVAKLYPCYFTNDISVIYNPYGITTNDIDKWEKVRGWSGPMQMDFSNYTIGSLIPEGHSYSDPDLKQRVRGFIMMRVSDFGWNENRFGKVDNNIRHMSDYSRHNDSDKIDRFGKKYSWIAYYEAAGILQDNSLIYDEFDKWRPAGLDIDPTFASNFKETDSVFLETLGDEVSMDDWLYNEDDLDITSKLYVSHNISENITSEFVCLYGHISRENKSLDRSRFAFIRPFIIKSEDFDKFVKYLQDADLSRHIIVDEIDNYSCCAGEISAFPDATHSNWVEMSFRISSEEIDQTAQEMEAILQIYIDDNGNVELDPDGKLDGLIDKFNSDYIDFKVMVPTMNYCASYDCSIGSCNTLSKEIIFSEHLYFIPQTFNLEDSNGDLAFYNVSGHINETDSQHYSYLRRDLLDSFLRKNGLSMLWLIWGEKDRSSRPVLFEKYKQLISYKNKN